ncbi:MAG: hypothetical protein RL264_858 [Bacteroidota bacterium]|jgi:hypothetical protein
MRITIFGFLLLAVLWSCSDKSEVASKHPLANYFYPYDTVAKVYLYRDVAHGLEEEFHRIYGLNDSYGHHIVVERYASDGRVLEAMNYNVDSLDVADHMVVDRFKKKEKAILYKTPIFPWKVGEKTWFASKFHGVTDSTLILKEIKRKALNLKKITVLEEQKNALVCQDEISMTVLNPFTKKEQSYTAKAKYFFADGIGLCEWYNRDKSVHFRLEKILTQKEWLKIIAR